ncbi:MAG: hypothetical protein V4550_07525 [Gemmatimonadota bacterium]
MAVYVDDFLSIDDLWETIPMQDIMAIETYPDAMSVPMKWRHLDVCAAVAIWTKH